MSLRLNPGRSCWAWKSRHLTYKRCSLLSHVRDHHMLVLTNSCLTYRVLFRIETGFFRGRFSGSSSDPSLPTTFPCVQIITNTTSLLPVTRVSAGFTSTLISTITAATIGAYGVKIEYTPDDKLEQSPDPERFNKAGLTFGDQGLARNHDLGPEMRVGVGAGICVVVGLIAFRCSASSRTKAQDAPAWSHT